MISKTFRSQIGDIAKEVILPVHKADRRYFPLYRDTNKEPWGIISHVRNEYGSTVVTIHGVVKVNHLSHQFIPKLQLFNKKYLGKHLNTPHHK